MADVIHFAKKAVVETKKSAYYDHTIFEVPFSGEYNASNVRRALHKRVYSMFNSLGDVELAREGVIRYEVIHILGD